jgi:hypothetical protein
MFATFREQATGNRTIQNSVPWLVGNVRQSDDLFDAAFKLFPLQHHTTTAASADDSHIGSGARDSPFIATAGMGLSHSHPHSNADHPKL